ncbi:zinc finger protein 3-like isoform X1 [Penaeus chinensis]|uniref:zinc finger protein 3-like isoform X1 n=2 Tax=Penaeus chinensis TaxID=139456 RepID=UPI001FB6033B|nr:zinc finger protein 3-like isoform X1 [Penaeus chinensis]
MGTFANFDRICRLCGIESNDLIHLFENTSQDRNLVAIIKKYLRVTVNIKDALPQQVCGPCIAKLDEVVDFMDASQTTQIKLRNQLKDSSSDNSVRIHEDQLYELIQDVKVELEEAEEQFFDDLDDEDYGPHGSRRRNTRLRSLRGRSAAVKAGGKRVGRPKRSKTLVGAGANGEASLVQLQEGHHQQREDEGEETKKDESLTPLDYGDSLIEEANTLSAPEEMGIQQKCAVRCCVCKASFDQLEQLSSHSLEAHQLETPRYMCPQCPRTFPKVTSMTNHQRRKHQETLQGCPKCRKLYPAHYLWTRHMLVHSNTRPFSCDECDKKFKSKPELINHKKVHRPSEERYTHCCEVCGKRFTQKANLESHLRLHTGNRPFSCEFCGKCFSQRGNMEEHRRIHTGEKPFVCDVCGVSYSRQGQLAMHRRKHNGEKPHKCQYCEKEFLRREVLRKHEHMHTDTRPYKCSYCEKSFRDQGKRKVHERLHTGERPYECQVCGRGFCESGNLRKHLRVHQRRPGAVVAPAAPPAARERDGLLPPAISVAVSSAAPGPTSYSVPHTTFTFPGAPAVRHGVEGMAEGSLMLVPEVSGLVTPATHIVTSSMPHNPQPALAVPMAGSPCPTNHPLVTLRPLEEPRESPALAEGGNREDYRVSAPSSSFQTVGWALYQT